MSEIKISDVSSQKIDRVNALLAGIGNGEGIRNAMYNALNRAAISARAKAARFATKEYTIGVGTFKKHTKEKYHIHYEGGHLSGGVINATVTFKGAVIPLIEFSTKFTKDGYVSVAVKRGSCRKALDHAFVARVGSKLGIWERLTKERYPIEQKYGPSTAHMMENPEVVKQMEETVMTTFDQRIEHEIDRILNGW